MNDSLRADLLRRYLEVARPVVLHDGLVALGVRIAYLDWSALAAMLLDALARMSRNGVAALYVCEDDKGVLMMRSIAGADVGAVARHYGGGGGAQQAAFTMALDKWHALPVVPYADALIMTSKTKTKTKRAEGVKRERSVAFTNEGGLEA